MKFLTGKFFVPGSIINKQANRYKRLWSDF